jgi:hypothetical protein
MGILSDFHLAVVLWAWLALTLKPMSALLLYAERSLSQLPL